MAILSAEEAIARYVADAKRNCMLCMGRVHLRPTDAEQKAALKSVENLVAFFGKQFNELRKQDREADEIQNAIQNKRTCMDAIEICNNCDKNVDRLRRHLANLR